MMEGVYQVRGLDLSNISFVETDTNVIVIDPLISKECAQKALELYQNHRPGPSIIALIYTHSHDDYLAEPRPSSLQWIPHLPHTLPIPRFPYTLLMGFLITLSVRMSTRELP